MRRPTCLILLAAALFSTARAVPMAGLQAWYAFDGNTQDASGNGRHGTIHNTLGFVDGVHGQAGLFNGTTSWVSVHVPLSPGDWTICGWVWLDEINPSYTDWQNFISSWANNFAVGIANGSGRLTLWIAGATATAPASFPLHQPVFWLAEHVGNSYRLWQNGSVVATATGTFTPPMLDVLGQWRPDAASPFDREPLDGWLDDLCIYDRALSDAEKAQLLNPCGEVATPANLQIQAADPDVTLSWSAAGGATAYQVWASAGMAAPFTLLATTQATSWTDLNALPLGLRCYRVVGICQ